MNAIRTILCPVDFTPLSETNLELAIGLCQQLDAKLVLHHNDAEAPPEAMAASWMWSEEHRAEQERRPAETERQIRQLFDRIPSTIRYEAKVSRGPLEDGLLFLAKALPADLIVMGSHHRTDADHRSLTEQIVDNAACPVVTTGEPGAGQSFLHSASTSGESAAGISNLLVAVDLAHPSEAALETAWWLAGITPHRLQLAHVIPEPETGSLGAPREIASDEERRNRDALRALVPEHVIERTECSVRRGDPAEQIVRLAAELDARCIVLGGRRRSRLHRWLTHPTGVEVLHRVDRPVWFVPQSAR